MDFRCIASPDNECLAFKAIYKKNNGREKILPIQRVTVYGVCHYHYAPILIRIFAVVVVCTLVVAPLLLLLLSVSPLECLSPLSLYFYNTKVSNTFHLMFVCCTD